MKTYKIVFSPTGGTDKIATSIATNWPNLETIDLSNNDLDFNITLEKNSLAIIAMPSFGGIAPQTALDRLSKIKANNSKCAVAAVYGNRAYDDTLLQIKDYAEKAGFQVISAVSAIAEHSIIHEYATSRPNENDCNQLATFGEQILEKSKTKSDSIKVPGNNPYKKAGASLVPKTNSNCTSCKKCAKVCPTGAINPENPHIVDKSKCIGCMRCVSVCPVKARNINSVMKKIAAIAIKKECSKDKNNELFI